MPHVTVEHVNHRKKRQPLPAFRRQRDPLHAKTIGGPVVDIIAMLDDVPYPARTMHLGKLARRYAAHEGVYSIMVPPGSSQGPVHSYMSLATTLYTLASPEVIEQWKDIAFDELIARCSATQTDPAMVLVSDAIEAQRPDIGLEMLERICAWHRQQPCPANTPVPLRTTQGASSFGGLVALAETSAQRQRLVDMAQYYAPDPDGYLGTRMADLVQALANPDKGYYDSFVDRAMANATSPEFAPHVNPCSLTWAALNRCHPDALARALKSTDAMERLDEHIDTVIAAFEQFVFSWPDMLSRNDDLPKLMDTVRVLVANMTPEFAGRLRSATRDAAKTANDERAVELASMIDQVAMDCVVDKTTKPTNPAPRL